MTDELALLISSLNSLFGPVYLDGQIPPKAAFPYATADVALPSAFAGSGTVTITLHRKGLDASTQRAQALALLSPIRRGLLLKNATGLMLVKPKSPIEFRNFEGDLFTASLPCEVRSFFP